MIVVIPTIAGREELLAEALAGYRKLFGVEVLVVDGSGGVGAGFARGLSRVTRLQECVLLSGDDTEPYGDWPELEGALDQVRSGKLLCGDVYFPDGTLYGGGETGMMLEQGAPGFSGSMLATLETWRALQPFPAEHPDLHMLERGRALGIGPYCSRGFPIVEKRMGTLPWQEVRDSIYR